MAVEPSTALPLADAEVDALLAPLAGFQTLLLAVSGGADSTALMHLVSDWRQRRGNSHLRLIAATVDHGLRVDSRREAEGVALQAHGLGIPHQILPWSNHKPESGIQAAARAARYALLLDVARQVLARGNGPVAIITAHTLDDQAETMVMRLMRGSGVDGLTSIPARGALALPGQGGAEASVPVLRPLLATERARLVASLTAGAIPYVNDPSNHDLRFERVRVRAALSGLESLGLTRPALARTAARMQRARDALEAATDQLWGEGVTSPLAGVFELDLKRLHAAPTEIAMRLFRRVLDLAGGAGGPAELGAVEDAFLRLQGAGCDWPPFTLGGCVVEPAPPTGGGPRLMVYRECDRGGGLLTISLAAGEAASWDGRFWVSAANPMAGPVEVGALGLDWPALMVAHPSLGSLPVPARAIRGQPAFRARGVLLAVPTLAEVAGRLGDHVGAAVLADLSDARTTAGTGKPSFNAFFMGDRKFLLPRDSAKY